MHSLYSKRDYDPDHTMMVFTIRAFRFLLHESLTASCNLAPHILTKFF